MEGIDPVKSWQPAKVRCHIQPEKGKDKSENFECFRLEYICIWKVFSKCILNSRQ